jgi:hypothetical protein
MGRAVKAESIMSISLALFHLHGYLSLCDCCCAQSRLHELSCVVRLELGDASSWPRQSFGQGSATCGASIEHHQHIQDITLSDE